MYKTTATELKQNTKRILSLAKEEYVVVSRYDKPEAVIISYQDWLLLEEKKAEIAAQRKQQQKKQANTQTMKDRLKDYVGSLDLGPTDSVGMVREWRDDD